jgi:hypothetical protein
MFSMQGGRQAPLCSVCKVGDGPDLPSGTVLDVDAAETELPGARASCRAAPSIVSRSVWITTRSVHTPVTRMVSPGSACFRASAIVCP